MRALRNIYLCDSLFFSFCVFECVRVCVCVCLCVFLSPALLLGVESYGKGWDERVFHLKHTRNCKSITTIEIRLKNKYFHTNRKQRITINFLFFCFVLAQLWSGRNLHYTFGSPCAGIFNANVSRVTRQQTDISVPALTVVLLLDRLPVFSKIINGELQVIINIVFSKKDNAALYERPLHLHPAHTDTHTHTPEHFETGKSPC